MVTGQEILSEEEQPEKQLINYQIKNNVGDLYETEKHLKKFILSQSIAEQPELNLEDVEKFISERVRGKKEENFSFKKENDPSENENVFEDVLGKTLQEKNPEEKIEITVGKLLPETSQKLVLRTEDLNYS